MIRLFFSLLFLTSTFAYADSPTCTSFQIIRIHRYNHDFSCKGFVDNTYVKSIDLSGDINKQVRDFCGQINLEGESYDMNGTCADLISAANQVEYCTQLLLLTL